MAAVYRFENGEWKPLRMIESGGSGCIRIFQNGEWKLIDHIWKFQNGQWVKIMM